MATDDERDDFGPHALPGDGSRRARDDENKLPPPLSRYNETGGGAGAVGLTRRARVREALRWGGVALIGAAVGFTIGTVTVAPSDGAASLAGAEGQEVRPVCERWCYPFEPVEVIAGDTVRGRVELGLDVARIVEVQIFGIEATEAAARAFTYEWTRTGTIELCVEPRAKGSEHGRILGDLCTRDSCLARALKDFGHARQTL